LKIRYNSPVILTYCLASAGVLTLNTVFGESFIVQFFSSPSRFYLSDPIFYVRMFSYVFGHADWNHYLANFLLILLVGPLLEEKYGSFRLLLMIVLSTIITSISNILLFDSSLIGSSGISFMLITLASFSNIKRNEIPLTFLIVAILFLGREILNIIQDDNISQFSHVIGGIMGAIFGNQLKLRTQEIFEL